MLHDAFIWQDNRRFISSRRFVPPSFNDIRLVLNTAQVMSLVRGGPLELVTFDGDVTLYDDGQCLHPENPAIPRILRLMGNGTKIGIVTAAGYSEARRYYERLYGLLDALQASDLPLTYKQNLVVLGGESNYCFKFDSDSPDLLRFVPRKDWLLDEMLLWAEEDITELLDIAEASLRDTIKNMRLEASVVRKERAVGIIPQPGAHKFSRETLEETVLIVQKILVSQDPAFCGTPNTCLRRCRPLGAGCHFVPSMVCPQTSRWMLPFLTTIQEATMCLSTSAISPGVCWRASASLEGLKEATRCMLATSFSRLGQTTSKPD
jgi:hypothetical protein